MVENQLTRTSGERNGKAYDEDLIIDTHRRESTSIRPPPSRRRSYSPAPSNALSRAPRYPAPEDEVEYYARRTAERAQLGEAYNGATRDWAIVDVPPGTSRVKMDGVGGASQEITWQRYNGVRRSNFVDSEREHGGGMEIARREEVVFDEREQGRRFTGMKSRQEGMWTEITKDLVVKEAITGCGYDFEETELFFYVMEYLRYVSFTFSVPSHLHIILACLSTFHLAQQLVPSVF